LTDESQAGGSDGLALLAIVLAATALILVQLLLL